MTRLALVILMTVAALLPAPARAWFGPPPPVQVAETVELDRYDGLWYEVARSPNLFQAGCVCVTAYYTPQPPDTIGIRNACNNFFAGGSLRAIEGEGVLVDPDDSDAKLKIGFFGGDPQADYWILDVVDDPDDPTGPYRFAAIGSPGREYLFILSRTPRPRSAAARAALDGMLQRLRDQQYPTWWLFPSRQPFTCRYEDRAP